MRHHREGAPLPGPAGCGKLTLRREEPCDRRHTLAFLIIWPLSRFGDPPIPATFKQAGPMPGPPAAAVFRRSRPNADRHVDEQHPPPVEQVGEDPAGEHADRRTAGRRRRPGAHRSTPRGRGGEGPSRRHLERRLRELGRP